MDGSALACRCATPKHIDALRSSKDSNGLGQWSLDALTLPRLGKYPGLMADAEALLYQAFRDHFGRLLRLHRHLLDKVGDQEAAELGRRAAEAAMAPLIWGDAVGERWDTTATAEFLGVTRQALHDRVRRGTILGVPGRGVTWFPTWQFDLARREVRPGAAKVLGVFRCMEQPLQAVEIASWARQPQPELDALSPADWLADGRPDETLLDAARHTAARLAA